MMEGSVEESLGKVTIAPNVLVTIVQKTAASVTGVARLCDNVPGMKRLLGLHTVDRGVEVAVVDDRVGVDVYLVAKRGVDLLQMGRRLQREVNVHIEDIATELAHSAGGKSEKER
jgi:uncharacterized alkaline shock family protein YloU